MKSPKNLYIVIPVLLVLMNIIGCGTDSDDAGPIIVKTTPSDKIKNVPLNTNIELQFNEAIDAGSLDDVLVISPPVSGTITLDEKGLFLIFTISEHLTPDTQYTLTIKNISDTLGNEMEPYAFSFRTGQKDDILPQILETIPTANEQDVLEDTREIIVKFSENLDRIMAYKAFHIRGSLSGEVEIQEARWLDHTTYQVRLDSRFENEEVVSVKIDSENIVDSSGNRMKEDYSFCFTLEGINPVGRPKRSSQNILSYSIWQVTSGVWHIRWNTDRVRAAPPMYQSPSEPAPKPKPKPKPKVISYKSAEHYFSGTITSDGTFMSEIDPYSFSDGDYIQAEIKGNLVTVTGDEVSVKRVGANLLTISTDEIKVDGDAGDMVSMTDDTVMLRGDIVVITNDIVTVEGRILTVEGDKIAIKGISGSDIVVEGMVLNATGDVVVLEGEIVSVTGSALVVDGDIVVLQGNEIWFVGLSRAGDGSDGFDFWCDGLYLNFDIKIDDDYMKNKVFIGEKGKTPKDIPFELKSRYAYLN